MNARFAHLNTFVYKRLSLLTFLVATLIILTASNPLTTVVESPSISDIPTLAEHEDSFGNG